MFMAKAYGLVGLATIIFAEIALYFRIQPFTSFFCPLVWLGYILLVDNLIYVLKRNSLMTRHPKKIIALFMISIIFWLVFELYNLFIPGWEYFNIQEVERVAGIIAFATILPAVFETAELLRSIHLFDKLKGPKVRGLINKNLLRLSIVVGALFIVLPFFFYSYWWAWAMVWTGFFLFLDPINYLNGQPSIFGDLKNRKWKIFLSLVLASFVCGFLWEFWNWGAVARWKYNLPGVPFENIKIFEMPVLGYLGYPPFALELYAMYHFIRFLFSETKGRKS